MTDDLDRIRAAVSRVMLGLIWLQVPIALAAAVAMGNRWLPVGLLSATVAAAATLAWWRDPAGQSTRLTVAVAVIASLSLILAACAGCPFQIDLHMAYFAELAMLTAYCDRNVVLAGAAVTALHHLLLNFVMPALVFPDGSQLSRVLLHAGILVMEAAALVWLTASASSGITRSCPLNGWLGSASARAKAASYRTRRSGNCSESISGCGPLPNRLACPPMSWIAKIDASATGALRSWSARAREALRYLVPAATP